MTRNLTITLIIILSIALGLASCGKKAGTASEKKAELAKLKSQLIDIEAKIKALESELGSTSKLGDIVPVSVYRIQPETFRRFIDVQGHIESQKLASISATMGGRITRINFSEGSFVKRGAVIIETDSDILQKSLTELQNSYEFVKKLFQKQSNLWDQKAISEIQFLEAKNNKEALELKIETVKRQISESKVVAPFDGTIDRIFPKIGEMAAPGIPLAQISGGGELKLVANVSETYITTFKIGSPVEIFFPELNKTMESKITVISKAIDARNRTFRVEMSAAGLPSEVRPNMLCSIKFNDISIPNSIVIPLNALQKSSEGYYLYTVESSSPAKAKKKFVTVSNVADDKAMISEGLGFNDVVITEGVLDVADGQRIVVKN